MNLLLAANNVKQIAQFGNKGITGPTKFFGNSNYGSSGARGAALSDLETLVSTIVGILTVLAGLFFIVYFVIGATKWVTAGGDSSKVSKARDQMIQGVIGLVVVVGAYALIGLVGAIVGFDILNPAAVLGGFLP